VSLIIGAAESQARQEAVLQDRAFLKGHSRENDFEIITLNYKLGPNSLIFLK
jgi:hypothetical protein